MSNMLMIIPLIVVGIMILWGFVIGTRNVVIRIIGVVISLIAAIISVIALKNLGFSGISPLLVTVLSGTELGDQILDFLALADTLGDTLVSVTTAFAAPIVFAVAFVVFAIITLVVGWIVSLIVALFTLKKDRKKRSVLVIVPCVIAQALITLFVLLTPIAVYGEVANEIVGRIDFSTEDNTVATVIETIDQVDSTTAISIYRNAGGKAVCKWLTSFKIDGQKSNFVNEADVIGRIVGDVLYLLENEISEYGKDEADAIRDLSESISDSLILPAIAGDVIYSATDAWLADESFFDFPIPELEEIGAEIFDEAFIHLLQIFHSDARDHDAFCADLDTIAGTVGILAEDGIFSSLGEGENALIDKLSSGATVRKLVAEFGSNPGFKILIGDVTNIGMRAIGTALNIPENAEAIYSDFTGSIAEELTVLNNSGMSDDEKCTEFAEVIKDAFAESGIEAELDDEVVKLYAQMIIEDFGSYNEVTKEDISEFFRAYSEVSNSLDPEKVKMESGNVTLLAGSESYDYSSNAYEGKSVEEISTQSGAGLLAKIMSAVIEARTNGKTNEEIGKMIEEAYIDYAVAAGKDAAAAKNIADSIAQNADVVTESLALATANMRSPETMAQSCLVVTLQDLLVDAESIAAALNSAEAVEKEAEAIGNVFNSMSEIIALLGESDGSMALDDLSNVAENIGAVLDNLSNTGALGAENTGKLMTAVMQSESVRSAANLDMASATEIAKAATESEDGKVNYKETMVGIASGASIAGKLADENEELTREDIRELLDNMNPQTAKVLNAYMTESRIAEFGVPESKVGISTDLVNNLLTEMGSKEKYSNEYESEIDGITTLFDLLNAATAKDKTENVIFNHGDEIGRLNTNAYDFIGTVLGSDMVCNALERSLNQNGELIQDPFGIEINENNKDYAAVKDALDKHYSETSDNRVNLIAALFGIER